MKFLFTIEKGLWGILKYILMMVAIIVLTIGMIVLLALIQDLIFVPDEYIIWTVRDSSIRLAFLFEIIFAGIFLYLKNRKKPDFEFTTTGITAAFIKKHGRKVVILSSVILSLILYYMVVNVSVVFKDSIVDHSFFLPKGNKYSYTDVKSINTGIYGKSIPFSHSRGEFYYIIELKDGTKINLFGGSGSTKNDEDIYLTILELDKIFVDAGVPKIVDSKNFDITAKKLDKIYSDRIRSILELRCQPPEN